MKITAEGEEYELNGFDSLFLDHVDEVLDSDFEDSTLFSRDQPYQKLTMSKTGEGVLELTLSYPDRDQRELKRV